MTAEPRPAQVVRDELRDLDAYLTGLPAEFRQPLLTEPYEARRAVLADELRRSELLETASSLAQNVIDLRLDNGPGGVHAVPASLLGQFIETWQSLFDALGQAVLGIQTKRGQVQREVSEHTSLLVHAFPRGSFVVRMAVQRPPQSDLERDVAIKAFEKFSFLVSAGADRNRLMAELTALRSRVASNYARLLELLERSTYELDVMIADPRHGSIHSSEHVAPKVVPQILEQLRSIAASTESTVEHLAILNAANARTGSFEIDLGEEGTLSGHVANERRDLLKGLEISKRYRFRLLERLLKDEMTGEFETMYFLESVSELGSVVQP